MKTKEQIAKYNKEYLCGPCNMALGLLKDDPAIIREALKYVI